MALPMLYAIVTATLCLVLAWLLSPRTRRKSGKSTRPITVSRIYVHPIKSCKPLSVKEWNYNVRGLEYDRAWAVVDAKTQVIVTARDIPKMVLVSPTIDKENGKLIVRFPDDAKLPSFAVPLHPTDEQRSSYERLDHAFHFGDDLFPVLVPAATSLSDPSDSRTPSELFSTYLGREVRFVMQGFAKRPLLKFEPKSGDLEYDGVGETAFADGYPFLLVSEESFEHVKGTITSALSPNPPPKYQNIGQLDSSLWKGRQLQLERFRPNVVVSGTGTAFAEETWRKVQFQAPGEGRESKGGMIVVSRCGRCQLPNVDPETGKADPALPFKVISKYRRVDPDIKYTPCFGVNTVPTRLEGTVAVGDVLSVLEKNDWISLDGAGNKLKHESMLGDSSRLANPGA